MTVLRSEVIEIIALVPLIALYHTGGIPRIAMSGDQAGGISVHPHMAGSRDLAVLSEGWNDSCGTRAEKGQALGLLPDGRSAPGGKPFGGLASMHRRRRSEGQRRRRHETSKVCQVVGLNSGFAAQFRGTTFCVDPNDGSHI